MNQPTADTVAESAPAENRKRKRGARKIWNYHPELPIKPAPFYDWPIKPLAIIKHLLKSWSPLAERFIFLLIAVAIWYNFSPSLERTAELRFDWIAEVWLRNFLLILTVAGGLHLYLFTFKKQGDELRYGHLEKCPDEPEPGQRMSSSLGILAFGRS